MKGLRTDFLKLISMILVIICLSGCTKGITESDFYEFANEYLATEYYEMCDDLVYVTEGVDENGEFWDIESGIAEYYYNLDTSFIWTTATMVKICYYSEDAYEGIKRTMLDSWGLHKIADEYTINRTKSEVYYVNNIEHKYGIYKKFRFVTLSDEKNCICFFWFYDQDYDWSINTEEKFDEFYKTEFKWFEDR